MLSTPGGEVHVLYRVRRLLEVAAMTKRDGWAPRNPQPDAPNLIHPRNVACVFCNDIFDPSPLCGWGEDIINSCLDGDFQVL